MGPGRPSSMISDSTDNPDQTYLYRKTPPDYLYLTTMSSTDSPSIPMLISDIVTLNIERNLSDPFYVFARPESGDIATVTHLEFGRASHRAASLLRPNREGPDGQVVAIIALSDTVLYHAILVGLMVADLIPFPISPRNSPAGIFQLLRTSSCHRILATCVTLEPLLTGLKKHIAEVDPDFVLNVEEVPSVAQIYPSLAAETSECSFQPYLPRVSHPSLDDITLYMHSSGSTGFPKAISQTHRTLLHWRALPPVSETRDRLEKPLANMALPAFHLFGIVCQVLQPLCGSCVALYPPTATSPSALPMLPSPDNILDHAKKTNCRSLTTVPALLSAWSNSPSAVAYLKTLHTILWAGGPLPQRIGNALSEAGLKLVAGYGATELGAMTHMVPYEEDAKEWAWFRLPDQVKVRWVPQGDGTFECHILTWENHQPSVENLDDIRGYATSDLCINHPQKKHLWRIVGRIDDVIVHSSGEKTVPAPMEDIVLSSPHVVGAVMFGRERVQTGILIETPPNLQIDVRNHTELAELRNKIWPIVEEANQNAPAFSRIFKEMILFTSSDKPLPRAGKGTVLRKAALSLYAPEIESIYNHVEDQISVIDSIDGPAVWEFAQIQEWLTNLAAKLVGSTTILPKEDLFKQGFDSLTATLFRLHVMKALRSRTDEVLAGAVDAISQNLVYSYPTISELSTYLNNLGGETSTDNGRQGIQIQDLIDKYNTSGLTPAGASPNPGVPAVVLLTGSTGNLGSQILSSLLKDDRVTKVYAFNRPSGRTLTERHLDIFKQRGLDTSLLTSPKLVFVEARMDQRDFGLKADLYEEVRNSVTLIIHNAWMLDFNVVLASFEPYILGTRHLIDLALSGPHAPRFIFTSSIASARSWDPSRGPCPEDILNDTSVAMGGYGQSKYVVEQILAKSALTSTSVRISQVCGALPKGAWATSDWVPILIKTSVTLGHLPLADGLVSWIDFETAAQAMMDVAFISSKDSGGAPNVLNLVHPRPVSWNFVITCIRDVLLKERNGSKDLKLVRFPDWYKKLHEAGGGHVQENLPGLKLLDFFRHLADSSVGSTDAEFGGISFSTNKMRSLSPVADEARSITEENVEAWVDYWRASGFI
ncbi:putative aminoadipate reductase [Mycena maculata]|uniref:Aminoadipate reductase n=1 Tax=Mycena maculata TaxID=230809 RepID=A0AAD7P041_9AGAR|nr:putative aminoadipate reductase [Mycena maculata]